MKTALLVISLKNKVIDEALKGPISDALKRVGKRSKNSILFYMWIFMVFHTLKFISDKAFPLSDK